MLTLFPNYGVLHSEQQLWLEASSPLFIDALCEAGIRIAVAAQQHIGTAPGNYLPCRQPSVRFRSIGVVGPAVPKWRALSNYLRQVIPILKAVWSSQFCYVYVPGHVGLLAVLSCRLLRRSYAVYLRGDFLVGTPRLFHGLQRGLLAKASFVICTGNQLRDRVARVNPNAEAVVPMSPVLFVDAEDRLASMQRRDTVAILFVGEMLREKGIFELLSAFEQLARRGQPKIRLTMIGEGQDRFQLMNEIRTRGLADCVQCPGLIQDARALAATYQRCDLFCLPSYYPEGFPRVLYEAMRFALPIVTTPVGEIATVIRDGANGLLCIPGSVESLTEKLAMLLESESLRQKLGAGGRATLEPLLEQWRGQTHGHQVLAWLRRSGVSFG